MSEDDKKSSFWDGFEKPKSSEEEIMVNLAPNTIYTGDYPNGAGKYISVNFDESIGFDVSKQIRMQIRLGYLDENKGLKGLKISKWRCTKDKCELQESVNFSTFDLDALRSFLELISEIDLTGAVAGKILLDAGDLVGSSELKQKLKTLLISQDGLSFLKDILLNSPELSAEDFVNVNYRKKQLQLFRQMLNEKHTEPEWQTFFENNPWIFGYGLQYYWTNKVGQKLEAVAVGATHNKAGKKPDGLLMTASSIRRSVFVEIKTPETSLIDHNPGKEFRKECWSPSVEFTAAIAQVQKTARLYCQDNILKERITTDTGDFKFDLYNISPRCLVIVGNLDEFKDEDNVNEEKYSSFEIYRNSLINPEIVTFDELYQRAKFIVESGDNNLDSTN